MTKIYKYVQNHDLNNFVASVQTLVQTFLLPPFLFTSARKTGSISSFILVDIFISLIKGEVIFI